MGAARPAHSSAAPCQPRAHPGDPLPNEAKFLEFPPPSCSALAYSKFSKFGRVLSAAKLSRAERAASAPRSPAWLSRHHLRSWLSRKDRPPGLSEPDRLGPGSGNVPTEACVQPSQTTCLVRNEDPLTAPTVRVRRPRCS